MAIQPIDMQVMIHKSTEVNKTNNELQRNNEQQQMFAEEFSKNLYKEQQQVTNTNKSEQQTIEYGKNGNKGQYNKRNKRKKDENKDKEKDKNKNSSSMFDVSI